MLQDQVTAVTGGHSPPRLPRLLEFGLISRHGGDAFCFDEVYDIGADSEDDIGHISSAVRALDVEGRSGGLSQGASVGTSVTTNDNLPSTEGDLAPWHERCHALVNLEAPI